LDDGHQNWSEDHAGLRRIHPDLIAITTIGGYNSRGSEAMNFDPTFLSNFVLVLTGFGGAF